MLAAIKHVPTKVMYLTKLATDMLELKKLEENAPEMLIPRPHRVSAELAVLRRLGGFGRTLGPDVLAASAGGKVMDLEAEDGPEKICGIAATAR